MSLAILSAVSAFCVAAATFGQPIVAQSSAAAVAVAAAQESAEAQAPVEDEPEDLTIPPPVEVAPAPVSNTPDNIILDEEQFTGPLAFEGESDEAIVDRLIGYLEETRTLQGDFTQIAPSGAISTGRFYLRRPGLLRFEYDPPTPLLIVANGGLVYVRDEDLETTDSYPVSSTPLKFLLRETVELENAEVLAVDRGVDNVAVTVASTEEGAEGEISIIVSAPEMQLRRWIVRDQQNGITVVTLDNVLSGERLANRLFRAPEAGGQFLKN